MTFLRVMRMMRGSCVGLTAWNSACPSRSFSCSSSWLAASSAIGVVSTMASGPPYGPVHAQRRHAPWVGAGLGLGLGLGLGWG